MLDKNSNDEVKPLQEGEELVIDAKRLSRRDFVRISSLLGTAGVVSGLLAACGASATNTPIPVATTAAPAATTAAVAATTAAAPAATTAAPAATTARAVATTAAPVATTAVAAKAPTGTLIIAQGVDIESLDPYVTTSGASKGIMWTMFDRMVYRDLDLKIQPGLAVSWRNVDDLTWEIKLRQGVKFHNGEPFNAEAVKFSFARFVDPTVKNGYSTLLKPVKEVKIVDDYTVQVITSEPFGELIEILAGYMEVLPPKAAANTEEFLKKPIGSGPYKFVSWSANDKFVLEAGDPHWSGQPLIKQVIFRPIPEATARINELRSGGVDIITNVSPLLANSLQNQQGIAIPKATNTGSIILIPSFLNTEVFKKKEVRQAMNYAIDKEQLVKVILQGNAVPLTAPYAKGIPGGWVEGLPQYNYDPEKAKSLLTQAGFPSGFKVSFKAPNGRYLQDKQIAEAIVGQLAKVGITAELEVMEWSTYVQGITGRKYELFLLSQGGVQVSVGASTNWSSKVKGIAWQGYTNPQVDDLIDRAGKTVDEKTRIGLYEQMSKLVWDEAPWIFLYSQVDLSGVRESKVKNFKPTSEGLIRLEKTEVTG
jgi:peptide/nickel transport system substrate-binding protein